MVIMPSGAITTWRTFYSACLLLWLLPCSLESMQNTQTRYEIGMCVRFNLCDIKTVEASLQPKKDNEESSMIVLLNIKFDIDYSRC